MLHALLVTMFSEKGGQIARLVDWRANTSRRTIYRYDVLRAVARQARPAIHRILQTAPELAKRASPRFGVTPLHLAAHHGVPSLVSALLSAGADAAAVSSGGRTPVDEAMHNGNFEALALLLAALPPAASAEARRRVTSTPRSRARRPRGEAAYLPAVPRRAPMAEGADDGAAAAACDATGGWGAPLGGAAGEAARSAQWGRDIDLRTAALSSPSCTNRTTWRRARCCCATPSRSPNAARSRRRRPPSAPTRRSAASRAAPPPTPRSRGASAAARTRCWS